MTQRIQTQPLQLEAIRVSKYDLVVATTGFESRARFLVEMFSPTGKVKWAPAFEDRQELGFEANRDFFGKNGYDTSAISDRDFRGAYSAQIEAALELIPVDDVLKVFVDISSMSRFRMATLIEVALRYGGQRKIDIDFAYCVAEYTAPPTAESPIINCGPVSTSFAGWAPEPSIPVAAVFGVGYEQDQVLGVLDLLEASEVWVFVPIGPDRRYLDSVNKANQLLFDEVPELHRFFYDLMRPYEMFGNIESLLYGLSAKRRPIVIPFGPKIFALCGMLAAAALNPRVAIWRVSTDQSEPPVDRIGTPSVCGISAQLLVDK